MPRGVPKPLPNTPHPNFPAPKPMPTPKIPPPGPTQPPNVNPHNPAPGHEPPD